MERGRLGLIASLAVLTAGAWVFTIHQAGATTMPMGIVARGQAEGMVGMGGIAASGMAGSDWTWAAFAAFLLAWTVMMAAMMFPSAAPMLLVYRAVSAKRASRRGSVVATWIFAAAYFGIWIAAGVLTWFTVRIGSDLAGSLDAGSRRTWAPLLLGGTLIAAGLYQLTPLKRVCLGRCRSPLGFVAEHWRGGFRGAAQMGVHHGVFCLGCCWALFAVLVAAGVMSLAWMLLLTLVVFAEKVWPLGAWGSRAIGAAFLALGALVAAGGLGMPWIA
jgi:predicted metal-binding membrane protein